MFIGKIDKNRLSLKRFLAKKLSQEFDMDICWEYFSEYISKTTDDIIIAEEGNKLLAIATIRNSLPGKLYSLLGAQCSYMDFLEIDTWKEDQRREISQSIMGYIKSKYPNIIIELRRNSCYINGTGFVYANNEYEDAKIIFNNSNEYILIAEENKNLLMDAYIKSLDCIAKEQVVVKVLSAEEIENLYYDDRIGEFKVHTWDTGSNVSFAGLKYFFTSDIINRRRPKDVNYFIAYKGDVMIGVVCLGDHIYDTLCPISYYEVEYISVHPYFKQQGVATKLYEALDEWIPKDAFLCATSLSREGRTAKINETRKRIVKCKANVDTSMDFIEHPAFKEEYLKYASKSA